MATFKALVYKPIVPSEYLDADSLFICHISSGHSFITSLKIFVLCIKVSTAERSHYMEKLSFYSQSVPTSHECGRYLEFMS